ncbi:MAG TPA: serine/threonine-protein kinase [Planctomycetaceae bacterium]|nr:serine/threonine-protein kinase [Planctomycetaceae bacterium]
MTSSATNCPQCGTAFPAGYAAPLCPACLLKLGFESRDPSAGPATSPYQPRFLAPTPEELAPRFPQLEILERIGAGGMGVVYRARQKELDRIVALKILRPDFGPEANFAERFQREARALARLSHPHIVTVHDFGRIDDVYYFVMEYIDGVNLRQLEKAGQLTPTQALALVPQVCEALQYAHEQGVVHRDIKPENILITRDGRVKIADFGLAKLAGHAEQSHLTGTWQVMGTPHYMAPEQVERPTEVDHRADIYSLGVVFYEMLTGELPLGRFPLPSSRAQLDIRLDDVVLRSLEKSPERRYQHATDVQTDVEQIRQTPGKKTAKSVERFAGEPDVVRKRVLASLELPANALIIVGLVEFFITVVYFFLIPPLAPLLMVVPAFTIWTGLTLKTGENLQSTVIGGCVSLIPVSFLWPVKAAICVASWMVLRHPPARAAFGQIGWREGEAWQTIQDWFRQTWIATRGGAATLWQATWNRIPSPASAHAAVAAVKEHAAQLPERAAPAVRTVAAVIRHPIPRGVVAWAFWSVVWSAWCIFAMMLTVELTDLSSGRYRAEHERLFTTTGLLLAVGWVLGEIVLVWNGVTQCLLRMSGQPASRISGPRRALFAASGAALLMSVLLLIGEALGAADRWSDWYDLQNPAGFGEVALVQLLFALCCGLSAVLLRWPAVRWVTRILLLLAVAFPAALLLAMSVDRGHAPPVALTLWPTAMSLPAVLWGFWGTRREPAKTIEPAAPVQPAEPSGLASTTV